MEVIAFLDRHREDGRVEQIGRILVRFTNDCDHIVGVLGVGDRVQNVPSLLGQRRFGVQSGEE